MLLNSKLQVLIRSYCIQNRPSSAADLHFFSNMSSFEDVLETVSLAKEQHGKRQKHQRRISPKVLLSAKQRLFPAKNNLKSCNSFEMLHTCIKDLLLNPKILGLGELYFYDTALRIGAYLNLLPEKVYLHSGTRIGAKKLGIDWKKESLDPAIFPEPFKALKPYEIEDFLCIYKDTFEKKDVSRRRDLSCP